MRQINVEGRKYTWFCGKKFVLIRLLHPDGGRSHTVSIQELQKLVPEIEYKSPRDEYGDYGIPIPVITPGIVAKYIKSTLSVLW